MKTKFLLFTLLTLCYYVKAQTNTLTPDLNFGNNGYTIWNDSPLDVNHEIFVLPDNKVLTAGITNNPDTNFISQLVLTRLLSDGTIDNSYGVNGRLITDFILYDYFWVVGGIFDYFQLIDNNQIFILNNPFFTQDAISLRKFNINLQPDLDFGINGSVNFSRGALRFIPVTYKVQQNSILITGGARDTIQQQGYSFLLKLNLDGSVDSNFGNNGLMLLNVPVINFFAYITNDNKILLNGYRFDGSSVSDTAYFYKLNMNGTFDNAFGTNGVLKNSYMLDESFPTNIISNDESKLYHFIIEDDINPTIGHFLTINTTSGTLVNSQEFQTTNGFSAVSDVTVEPNNNGYFMYLTRMYKFNEDGSFNPQSYYDSIPWDTSFNLALKIKNNSIYLGGMKYTNDTINPADFTVSKFYSSLLNTTIEEHVFNLTVAPNPFNNTLEILNVDNLGNSTIKLYDLSGRLVLQQNLKQDDKKVDTSQILPGFYIVEIISTQGTFRKRIIRE